MSTHDISYHYNAEILGISKDDDDLNADTIGVRDYLSPLLLLEILYLCIFPWPYFDYVIRVYQSSGGFWVAYYASDLTLIAMFPRIIIQGTYTHSMNTYTDVYSRKICQANGIKIGKLFSFKTKLITAPSHVAFELFFVSIVILGVMM